MLGAMGSVGAFGFYAGLNILAFIMILLLVPGKFQTQQKMAQEIFSNFNFFFRNETTNSRRTRLCLCRSNIKTRFLSNQGICSLLD